MANMENIREIKHLLITAFNWAKTPPGEKYWDEVYENLKKIEDANEKE